MERIGGEDARTPTSIRKVVVASSIGTTIEWYAYLIFVTAASLMFPDVFFPGFGPTAGKIQGVLCYAAETYRKDIYEEEPAERQLVAERQG